MRSETEYRAILELWEQCIPKKRIGIMLGIPRATVRDCINRYGTIQQLDEALKGKIINLAVERLTAALANGNIELLKSYAYLLGMYLGDGYIDQFPRTHRLRIKLDALYPKIIEYCGQMLKILFPENKVTYQITWFQGHESSVDVILYSTYLADHFPQVGAGAKHTRSMQLESWQTQVVEAEPLEFLRGLFHSDGSRFDNVVNGTAYPRYQFTNCSQEIAAFFTMTCERLGIHYTTKTRPPRKGVIATDVYVSRRADVAYLDEHIERKC
jgi:hypothetical protein